MSHRVHLSGEFQSYTEFKFELDEFCRENATKQVFNVSNADEILQTACRLMEQEYRAMVQFCKAIGSTGSNTSNENGINQNDELNFVQSATCNSVNAAFSEYCREKENSRLSTILNIMRKLSDKELDWVEQVCKDIYSRSNDERNAELTMDPVQNEMESYTVRNDTISPAMTNIHNITDGMSTQQQLQSDPQNNANIGASNVLIVDTMNYAPSSKNLSDASVFTLNRLQFL